MSLSKQKFYDTTFMENEKVICYRSGLSVFEECFEDGTLVSAGSNAAGYPLNVMTNCPTRLKKKWLKQPSVFLLDVDGVSLSDGWKFVSFEKNGERKNHIVVKLIHDEQKIALYEHTIMDGSQMITRYLEIENLSNQYRKIEKLGIHAGALESFDAGSLAQTEKREKKTIYSIGYFAEDSWSREGDFTWKPLTDSFVVNARFNADRFRHPLFMIRNNISGKIYFAQMGWSGGCRFAATCEAGDTPYKLMLSYSAEVTAHQPILVLNPKEKLTTPELYFGVVQGSLDAAVQQMHEHIRSTVLTNVDASADACLIGAGMGPDQNMDMENTMAYIRKFSKMGAEVFILDAGWYCPLHEELHGWWKQNGIHVPNAGRYPDDGLSKIRDYCHSLNMKFGMWTEIERIGYDAGVAELHPDWFLPDIHGNKKKSEVFDLTNKEAYEWAYNELKKMIQDFKLDLLRVDYNIEIPDTFRIRTAENGQIECANIRHNFAVYKLYSDLKKEFPNVIFENCAGGGGRTDLGQMKAFNHTWVSDNQSMPKSIEITNGMTIALPPERVDRLFAGMGCHTIGAIDAHMRNTMLTHMSLNVIAPAVIEENPDIMEFVRHSTDVYKSFIRPMISNSLVWHLTPTRKEVEEKGYSALEISSKDGSKAAITIFTMPTFADDSRITIFPRGIHANRNYKVTWDNNSEQLNMSGIDILRWGIPVMIQSSLSSELLLLEELTT